MATLLTHNPTGPIELDRGDGWYYKLHGIFGLEMRYDEYDFGRATVVVQIADVSDETLASVKVLRDTFSETTIKIETY